MWEDWRNSGPDVKILGGPDSQGSGFSPLIADPLTALPLDCPEVFANHHQIMASAERQDSFWQDKSSSCFVNLHMWTDKFLPGRFDLGSPLISDIPEGVLLTPPAEPSWVPENETGEKMGVFSDDLPQEPQEEKEVLTCLWIGCNTTLESQKALVEHIERAHVEGRRDDFNCFWLGCPRRNRPFNARYKLMIHMRVHTGFKPNICSYPSCSKAFSRLENLKIHYRSHTGERPYVCPHCTKAFSNSSDRAKHQRTHFDTKPYACTHPNCGKRYTDPSSLRKHAKMHFVGMATSAPVPIQKTGMERITHRSNYAQSLSPSPPATPCTPLTPQSPVVQPTLFSSSAPGALGYSDFEEPKCTFTFPETSVVDDFMVELDWMAAMDLEDIEQILSSDAN